jgi:hypothetical protein
MRGLTAELAEAALRSVGAEPKVPYPGQKKTPWPSVHLACGRDIYPRLSNLRGDRGVCRYCAGYERGAARRGRLADAAVAEMRLAGWEPLAPYPGTAAKWLSRHVACGAERETTLNRVRRPGRYGCETCWRRIEGHRTWDAVSAQAFMESLGLTPLEPWPGGSSRPWSARHDACGRPVSPRLGNLAAGQGPCNHCGHEAGKRKMMLDDSDAEAMMRRAGLHPISPFPGVDKPWLCIHIDCGKQTSPTYTNIKRGQGGCSPCGDLVLARLFRMPEQNARDLMLEQGLEPLEPYVNSNTPWRCRHTCGREVTPRLSTASRGLGICRYCNSAFPFDGPAEVYMVADAKALKVGIASPKGSRITQHTSLGWRLKWRVSVPTGDDAYALEQSVIKWWRETLDAKPAYSKTEMPQWGSTETVSWDATSAVETLEYVLQLAGSLKLRFTATPSDDVHVRPELAATNRRSGRSRRGRGAPSDLTLF